MSDFGAYSGRELFEKEFPKRAWLVEGIIKEKDSVILVGDPKAGKSLLAFQLICSMTSQHPFLDHHQVMKPCRVSYVQLEGELVDSQDRFKRMSETLDIDPEMFQLIFSEPLALQSKEEAGKLIGMITKQHRPDVLVIDPAYFAMKGSLKDDERVRDFTGCLRLIKDFLGCAIILVHHTHKIKMDPWGNIIDEGDQATFGSQFFSAWVDHLILFAYDKKSNLRSLSCRTQRSGEIMENLRLRLVQPKPLYFEIADGNNTTLDTVLVNYFLRPENRMGKSAEVAMRELKIKKSSFYSSIKGPLNNGMLEKIANVRPVVYKISEKVLCQN